MTNQEISKLIDEKIDKVRQELKAQLCLKWEFSEDEKVILRNLREQYKYIARDECKQLFAYMSAPYKSMGVNNHGQWFIDDDDFEELSFFPNLFKQITWEDSEPCEFRKFI